VVLTRALAVLTVVQWAENGGDNQRVRFEPASDGWGLLRFKHSGKLVSIAGGDVGDGGKGVQWHQQGTDNQRVRLVPQPDGWFTLNFKHSGHPLSIAGGTAADGGEGEATRIVINVFGRMVLNTGGPFSLAAVQWHEQATDNQHVRFEPRGDGWGYLRYKHSGKVLSVAGGTVDDGGVLVQWHEQATDNQFVRFEF
jgi:hypothetical protein